jgi:hypothetical protein
MEAPWLADRTTLRTLLRTQRHCTLRDFAEGIGRSLSGVKKWIKRLRGASPEDPASVQRRSRARTQPQATISHVVVERILALRDEPPAGLRRVPGPRTIRYYLEQDQDLRAQGLPLPDHPATRGDVYLPGRWPHRDRPAVSGTYAARLCVLQRVGRAVAAADRPARGGSADVAAAGAAPGSPPTALRARARHRGALGRCLIRRCAHLLAR